MSKPPQSPQAEDGSQDDPSPPAFQFVSVGSGGTVSSISTVRSHVMKGQHQKRRENKKALLKRGQQKLLQLRPSQATTNSISAESSRAASPISPLATVQYNADFPYAWFEKNGPVLHVNKSRWPFPTSFQVTASDRKEDGKSLTPRQSHWMPYTRSPDHTMVKGAVLDAAVLAWLGTTQECFEFRVQTINWIQEQMNNPDTAVNNSTLGAIMTFTQWTAGYKDPNEISRHMSAVERIVDLRGGFLSFQTDVPMIAKLTLFDQMVAVLTGKRQRFPSVEYFVSRPITRSTNDQIRHHGSPLSFSGDFDGVLTYHKSQAALRSCLKHVWTLTQNLECQTPSNSPHAPEQFHDPIPFIEESRHSYKTSLLTLPLVSACYAPCHNHVLETIQHSSTLYSRTLTTPGLDFPSPPNEHSYKELYRAFAKCSHDDLWVRFPGVLLWVLLVGTAAARGKEEAAFWMFYLARTGSFSNADGWLMEGAAIRRFLEIQRLMREASSATHVS